MSLSTKKTFFSLLLFCVGAAQSFSEKDYKDLFFNEVNFHESYPSLRYLNHTLHKHEHLNMSSGDLFDQFVQFLFPTSGREKRTVFLPAAFWGPKKPQYRKFNWKSYESKHFVYYYAQRAKDSFELAHAFLEDDYFRNNQLFSVRNKFLKKIPIIIYQSRKDFEQTHIVSGPVPEGLGGVTEIFSWKRAVFPFEGEMQKFEHVTKHEGTHIYQIAKGAKNLPLWFIEGSAETNSSYWDKDAEMFIRDAYLNGYFFDIKDLWRIRGTWLMYKIGNFICNFIYEEFGEKAFQKIYENSKDKKFNDNLISSIGVDLSGLNRMIKSKLAEKYLYELKSKQNNEKLFLIKDNSKIIASHDQFFISGESKSYRNALYVNYLNKQGKVASQKKIIQDKKLFSESLNYFQKGADLNAKHILYVIKNGLKDEVRKTSYSYDFQKRKINLSKSKTFSFESILSIASPVIIDDKQFAFVGYENGYSNVYIYNSSTRKLEKITDKNKHIQGLDYSKQRDRLIFSMELERHNNRIYYNRDLFEYDIQKKSLSNISNTPNIKEINPQYSSNGDECLFSSDQGKTYNLYKINLESLLKHKVSNNSIGIKSAFWSGAESILLNVQNKFKPSIRSIARPSVKKMIQKQFFEKAGLQTLHFDDTGNTVFLDPSVKKNNRKSYYATEDFEIYTLNNKPSFFLETKDNNYEIKNIATIDNKLFITAKNKNIKNQILLNVEENTHYFTYDGLSLKNVYKPNIIKANLSEDLLLQLKNSIDSEVISAWHFTEKNKALVQVNQKLKQASSNNKKNIASLKFCDLTRNTCKSIPDFNQKNFKFDVFWASIFVDDSILFAVAEKKSGPFAMYLFNKNENKTYQVGKDIVRFKVSPNLKSFVLNKGQNFIQYHWSNQKWLAKSFAVKSNILAYDYLKSGVFSLLNYEKGQFTLTEFGEKNKKTIQFKKLINQVVSAGFNKITGDFVVHAKLNRIKKDLKSEKQKVEKLYFFDVQKESINDLSNYLYGDQYYSVGFIDEYLIYTSRKRYNVPLQQFIFHKNKLSTFGKLENIKYEQNFFSLLVNYNESLFVLQKNKHNAKYNKTILLSNDVYGFDTNNHEVVFSNKSQDKYVLKQYNFKNKKLSLLKEKKYHVIEPKFIDSKLVYTKIENEYAFFSDVKTVNTKVYQNLKKISPSYNIKLLNGDINNKNMSFTLFPIESESFFGPKLLKPNNVVNINKDKKAKNIFKLRNLAAAAAYDGSNFRIFINSFVDNIFSDQGFYTNIILLGPSKFGVAGFADLKRNLSYSFYFSERYNIKNYGLSMNKKFILDRYRAIDLTGDLEMQSYGSLNFNTSSYLDNDILNKKFYVSKLSTSFSQDLTLYDRHGPKSGHRLFFRFNVGYDPINSNIAQYGANADIRVYHDLGNNFALAHRLSTGINQGSLHEVYLAGGNLSYRGKPFDEIEGQNYIFISEDFRIPIFDFIGAKLFDPLDSYLGFLTRFYDVRGGLFIDAGANWYNGQKSTFSVASGYFVNVPTLLGVNVRFHHSLIGDKNIGFWMGSNW